MTKKKARQEAMSLIFTEFGKWKDFKLAFKYRYEAGTFQSDFEKKFQVCEAYEFQYIDTLWKKANEMVEEFLNSTTKRILTISSDEEGVKHMFVYPNDDLELAIHVSHDKEAIQALVSNYGDTYFIYDDTSVTNFKEPTIEQITECLDSRWMGYDHPLIQEHVIEC